MIRESFADGTSIIHKIDPRVKIVVALIFSFQVAVAKQVDTLVCSLVLAILLLFLANLNLRQVVKKYSVVFAFLLLVWLLMPFTYEGDSLGKLGPLTLFRPGVTFSIIISLKSTAIVLGLMALMATMPLASLGHALNQLRIPGKVVHLLLMTYRYIHVIETEYQRLMRAAKIRGVKPGTNIHTYRTYAYFVGVLFIRAVERADRVSEAMKCRGFNGHFYCLAEFPSHIRNWIFSVIAAICILTLACLEWAGFLIP